MIDTTLSVPAPATLSGEYTLLLEPVRRQTAVKPVKLSTGRHVIGSAADCATRLDHEGVGPRHCLIMAGGGRTILRALDRRTWLNDYLVREAVLKPGDRLAIGPVEFHVRSVTTDRSFDGSPLSTENEGGARLDLRRLSQSIRAVNSDAAPANSSPADAVPDDDGSAGIDQTGIDQADVEPTDIDPGDVNLGDVDLAESAAVDPHLVAGCTSDDRDAEQVRFGIRRNELKGRLQRLEEEIGRQEETLRRVLRQDDVSFDEFSDVLSGDEPSPLDDSDSLLRRRALEIDSRAAEIEEGGRRQEAHFKRQKQRLTDLAAEQSALQSDLVWKQASFEGSQAAFDDRERDLRAGEAAATEERRRLEAEREALDAQRAAFEAEREQVAAGDRRDEQHDAARCDFEREQRRLETARREIESGREELETARREIRTLRQRAEDDRKQVEAGRKQVEAVREQVEADRKHAEAARHELASERERLEANRKKLDERQEKLDARQAEHAESETRLARREAELDELERRLHADRERHDARAAEMDEREQCLRLRDEELEARVSQAEETPAERAPDTITAVAGENAVFRNDTTAETLAEEPSEPGNDQDEEIERFRAALAGMFGLEQEICGTGDRETAEETAGENSPGKAGDVDPAGTVTDEDVLAADSASAAADAIGADDDTLKPDEAEDSNSIAAYMEQLLKRNRRSQSANQVERGNANLPRKRGRASELIPDSTTEGAEPSRRFEPSEDLTAAESCVEGADPDDSMPADEPIMKPRSDRDKQAVRANLDSLREVANLSARTAIASHTRRKVRGGIALKVVLTLVSFGLAVKLLAGGLWGAVSYHATGWSALMVGVIMAIELLRSVVRIRHAHSFTGGILREDPSRQVISEGEAPDEPIASDDERGTRR